MRIAKTKCVASLIGALLLVAGCGGGGNDVAATDTTTTTTPATTVNVITYDQNGTLAPQPPVAAAPDPNGWETLASRVIPDLKLIEDRSSTSSTGPDAWDATAHPLVYVASQNVATADLNGDGKFQKAKGLVIFDANTYAHVASAEYPDVGPGVTPVTSVFDPHGLGMSADGKWIYVEGTDKRSTDTAFYRVLNIINARTLKIDKIINTSVHHVKSIYDAELKKNLVLIDTWDGGEFLLDPSNNNKVVKAVDRAALAATPYSSYVDTSGKWLFVTTRTNFPGSMGGVTVFNLATGGTPSLKVAARIMTDDTSPIWVTFSANGKYAYVSNSASTSIARINISDPNPGAWKYDGRSLSGTSTSLYSLTLNWADTAVYGVPRIANASLGVALASGFGSPDALSGGKILGPVYLNGCQLPDHGILHPDPAKNELWISCTGSPDTSVVDMGDGKTLASVKVKSTLKSPNDGGTHNGSFVKYTVTGTTWSGELLSDTNGMQGSAIALKKAAAAAAGN